MELLLMLLPLVAIIVALVFKKHMIVAGIIGGVVAVAVSWILYSMGTLEHGLTFAEINNQIVNVGLKGMLSNFLTPVMYAPAAVMIAKSGSIEALIESLKRGLKGKLPLLAMAIVLVQAGATYMAGMGAGNTMVIAPLMATAVGFIPEVIGAMAIVTVVGFTTSPSAGASGIASQAGNLAVQDYAQMMLPITLAVIAFGALYAYYGVRKRGSLVAAAESTDAISNVSTGDLLVKTIPAAVFLTFVVLGGTLNKLIGIPVFFPIINVVISGLLCWLCCKTEPNQISANLVDGSRYILTTLFGVGIFLGFINMIGFLGTFARLAELVGSVSPSIIAVAACLLGFMIAIPSGAYDAGVLSLILPTISAIPGISPLTFGLIAISVGLGTQISPVQINVAALSEGFKISIMDTIKSNFKIILFMQAVVLAIALIVGLL